MRGQLLCKIVIIFLLFLFVPLQVHASSIAIGNGSAWLISTQNPDGTWGGSADRLILNTSTALDTFKSLNVSNPEYSNGIVWLNYQTPATTDYLARKISSLHMGGVDVSADVTALVNSRNTNGGWGGDDGSTTMINDTAFALQALKTVNYSDQTIINNAINYLLSNQNPDGGFGFCSSASAGCSDSDSNIYMTALVSFTLQQFPQTTSISTAVNKATAYLIANQNADGGFGAGASTVYETAYAYMAIINAGQGQAQPLQNAIAYLTATQSANGSWNDDPYSTALALRALADVKPNLTILSSDITFSKPNPTVGDTISITANIYNTGPAQADNVLVQFYDNDPNFGGILIGETTIASISAYGNSPASINYTLTTASSKTIYVSLDPLNTIEELNEADNMTARNITGATLSDLSVTSGDIALLPETPKTNVALDILIRIRNLGETDASNVLVKIYDGDPSTGGKDLAGDVILPSIPAGGAADVTTTIPPEQMTDISKSIYVIVDPNNTIIEATKTNNRAVKTFGIRDSVNIGISSEAITLNPEGPKEGDTVTITATVSNLGASNGYAVKDILVRFYLGDPQTGVQLGADKVIPTIPSRGAASVTTTWNTTGHVGNNDIYVVVDPDNAIAEDNEFNNSAFKTIKVGISQGPDLALVASDISFSPHSPAQGENVTINANIRNIGNADSTNVLVEFSLGNPNAGGTLIIGSQTIPFIAQGSSATVQTLWNTQGFAGDYEIYTNVDPFNTIAEQNEMNNMAYTQVDIQESQGPDLTITALDTSALITDTQTLQVSGTLKVTVENKGNQPVNAPFAISAFESGNGGITFDASDNILGTDAYESTIPAASTAIVNIPVSGSVLFRDNIITAYTDSTDMVAELDETNNSRSTSQQCEYHPPIGQFNPVEKWNWKGSTVLPQYNQVMHLPIVAPLIDTNNDGNINDRDIPAIIFNTFSGSYVTDGVLRAVRGDNGAEIFTVTNPAYRVTPGSNPVVGDIDNDGFVEIIAHKSGGGLIAFEHNGAYKWSSIYGGSWGGLAVADIDNDGWPEIITGATVINGNGSLKWQGNSGSNLSLIADIDMDGSPEIVAGNIAYRNNGTVLWYNASVPGGYNAVANFDDDLYPEIVLVGSGKVYLLEHTGQIKWGPVYIPGGGHGGPPTVADFDGDGIPEIGMAGAGRYVVIKSSGSVMWQSIISDYSSNATGSSVFDFEGDGKTEVVYNDEYYLRIYRGSDGYVLFQTPNSSGTLTEYPLIVDVDNDNKAEVVVVSNNYAWGAHNGIRVFEDANETWVNTRKIWNQHSYHITNVNDDGTIPRYEENSWERNNTYRCNSMPDQALASADITTSYITADLTNYPSKVAISARIGNGGAASQISAVDVAFYDGDPQAGGKLIGSTATTGTLAPGDYQDTSIAWTAPAGGSHVIYLVADKDHKLHECRTDNNIAFGTVVLGLIPPPSPKLPDLEITSSDVTILPANSIEGQPAVLSTIIHNTGNLGASDVVVYFYDSDPQSGGTLIGSQTKSFIDAGATALAEVTWNTFGQSGTNYIHVVVDPQNSISESNENNNATLIPVDVTPPSKPDLAITSSDISFSDLNPQEGEPLVITATVHNFGTDASDIRVNLYNGNPSSGGTIISTHTISQIIQFGGQTQISFSVDTVGLSGNHEFHILLDFDNTIDETNETNNTAWNSLAIGPSGLSLGVSADKTSYNANEDVLITVSTGNLTDLSRTGTLEVRMTDLNSNVVSIVSANQALTLGPNENSMLSYTWNKGQTLSGDYKVYAVYVENGNVTAKADTPIAITKDMNISSKVTTDKVAYYPNQPVTITSTITSLSTNYIFENLTAKIAVSDQLSAVSLYEETQTLPILIPGQLVEFKAYWDTATSPSGDYPVTLTIADASGNVLSASTTTLTISSDIKPSKLLKGQISVDRQSLLQGEPIVIAYSVTNIGNMDLSQVNLSVKTVHTVQLTVYDTLTDQTELLKGETYANSQQLNTQNYSAKDYLVILRANISGVEETLASIYFRVEGAPSAPSLNEPAHSSDIEILTSALVVNNASDPNDDKLTYQLELYADSGLSTLVSSADGIAEGSGITTWQMPLSLTENSTYYWRARAFDGRLYGQWMAPASFRVNVENDVPAAPTLSAPADNTSVDTVTPMLSVNNAYDPDSFNLTYNFEVSQDASFTILVASEIGVAEGVGTTSWQLPVSLQENTWYYWRTQADDWLATSPWMIPAGFFVNTANDAPSAPGIISPADGSSIPTVNADIVVANSTDPDSTVLNYLFEVDTVTTFDSADLIVSVSITEGQGTTSFSVAGLRDNTTYCSRAKASDALADSPWSAVSCFFVNTANDAPTAPVLANPSNGSGVNVFSPVLSVHNSADLDKDPLTYEFEVYGDVSLSSLVAGVTGILETPDITSWTVPVNLIENSTYYWRARADDGKAYSPWMPVASFMVNTSNDAPGAPSLSAPSNGVSLATLSPTLAVNNATDPDSDSLTYDFEVYAGGTLVWTTTGIPQNASGITAVTVSPAISDNMAYTWRARAYDGDRYGAWMDMASFSTHMPSSNITVTIEVEPETLNRKSRGNWVTVEIELPRGYHAKDVHISSIRLEGTVHAETKPYHRGCEHNREHHHYDNDNDHDDREIKVKFDRREVLNVLPNGEHVKVHVTGIVGTTTFEGVDTIRVIH